MIEPVCQGRGDEMDLGQGILSVPIRALNFGADVVWFGLYSINRR
jgi:hypothetical protein